MFEKILIANRGLAASRIARSIKSLGATAVAVYAEPDAALPFIAEADEALPLGGRTAKESYLDVDKLIGCIRDSGADAVHPGYGFLSENADFARAVAAAGATFIGPSPRFLEKMGDKIESRKVMADLGVPVLPATEALGDDADAAILARDMGYPVIVKAAGGGGGIGMAVVETPDDLASALERTRQMARRLFGTDRVYLERCVAEPRHVEFQIVGDSYGNIRHLFERDCSIQRRHQKVVEETPTPGLPSCIAFADRLRDAIAGLGYDSLGTVEMIADGDGCLYFLEMNTRLQVEHAVTEAVTGLDLVAIQIQLAAGARLEEVLPARVGVDGAAIEARIYAEDPLTFMPSPGALARFDLPAAPGIRIETGYRASNAVSPYFDPMLALVVCHAESRPAAIECLNAYLASVSIEGVKTNIPFIRQVLASDEFRAGAHSTATARLLTERGAAGGAQSRAAE